MKIISFLFLNTSLLLANTPQLHAQFPENNKSENRRGLIDPGGLGLGRPGFLTDATFMDTQDFPDVPGGLDFFQLRAIAPFWAKKSGDFLMATSLRYTLTELDFHGFAGLEAESLHSLQAQISMFWRPEESRWSALGFVTPGLGTDFQGISTDDFQVAGLGLVGYRLNDDFSLAGGFFGQYGAGDGMIVPAVGFVWQPGPFVIQMTPPFAVIGWHATDRLTLSLSAYPSGGAWDVEDPNVNRIDLSGWQGAASVMYKFTDKFTVSVRGGLNFGGELELRDSADRVISNEDLEPAPFVAVNLGWSF